MQLVGGQTYFLYGVSLEKQWWNDQLSLKFGKITAMDDFAGSPLYGFYLNNSIDGQIRAVLLDGVMTSYPIPVWGADRPFWRRDFLYHPRGLFPGRRRLRLV